MGWEQPPTEGGGTPGVEPAPPAEPQMSVEARLLLAEARAEVLEKEVRVLRDQTFAMADKTEPPPDRIWVTMEPAEGARHGGDFWWGVLGLILSVAAIVAFFVVAAATPNTTDYVLVVGVTALLLAGIAGLIGFPAWMDD